MIKPVSYQNKNGIKFNITGNDQGDIVYIKPSEFNNVSSYRDATREIQYINYSSGPFLQRGDTLEVVVPELYYLRIEKIIALDDHISVLKVEDIRDL